MQTKTKQQWLRAGLRELIWLCPAVAVAALALSLASCGSGMADLAARPAEADAFLPVPINEPVTDTHCSPALRRCLA